MATNKIRKFEDVDGVQLFLNGALFGGPLKGGIQGLVGRKLKFLLPAAVEYTFITGTGTDPYTLSLADIKTQLEGAVAGLRVRSYDGKLVLMEITPTGGVSIATATSLESRALLGLDTVGTISSKVYAPPPSTTAPCWTFATIGTDNSHIIYTWE